MPILPDARKCASKKAIDGVEDLMRGSSSTSNVSTPKSSNADSGTSRNELFSAPSHDPVPTHSLASSEGVPEKTEAPNFTTIAFGNFPAVPTVSSRPLKMADWSEAPIGDDDVDLQLRNMLQNTHIGTNDANHPVLNGYRA